ncbi:MAG: GGDEF domain-containing protein [Sedimenticola sp.]|uniref:diguanylate cyclase n=1 Tax=Sedimenticola thiotaurini TaxID=1543721 RepID=A0A558CWA1_9GAMM|nr:GGDEF domain-containing protein [Sedimenticola sp.]TVT53022.1 MAG: GGDEF domain-containing protein [Sedimenticola thiotaurini]MCW8946418.1 GGDEF domain-containing protein [Sedimenticola sp.]MCW8950522.1 GGDEF domain-containing protein [Sedimenticola sp.]MCW8977030.1 GGDEF domain-containing protein [Sedimenticola sp.]
MIQLSDDISEMHLLLGIIHNVDVGLVVLDRDYQIKIWNHFMWNHSGINPSTLVDKNLFEAFPDLPAQWLQKKLDTVFLLNNRAFSSWQQRPYIFKFNSYNPITGGSDTMFQNMTIFPLIGVSGKAEHVCLMLYDATDAALDEQALQAANLELDRLGRIDGLTGLLNRRAWENAMLNEFKRFPRSRQKSTMVMFDIDHFKKVNDTYGHQAGDEVIRIVSGMLLETIREVDIAGRYGGEEFCIVLLGTDNNGGVIFAERLREAVEATEVFYEDQLIKFTISLGVSEISENINSHTEWLEQADKALYESKEGGRNRTTLYNKTD